MPETWDVTTNGVYDINEVVTINGTRPTGAYGYGTLIVFAGATFASQIYVSDDIHIYYRPCINGVFRTWTKIC